MLVDEIAALTDLPRDELRALHQRYVRAHPGQAEDVPRFAAWLHQEGQLSTARYKELLSRRRLQLSALATLNAGLLTPLPTEETEDIPPLSEVASWLEGMYVDLGVLGRGSMGEVRVVQDHHLGRTVALKQLLPQMGSEAELARFYREAQITAQLEHPSIVPVYRLEQPGEGRLAYTMKLIDGVTLEAYIADVRAAAQHSAALPEALQLPARLRHFIKICEAIHYAHSRGFVHRDLKPANVMIGPFGEVYVMDWGLARRTDASAEEDAAEALPTPSPLEGRGAVETVAGAVMGTPAYMSPEQATGAPESTLPTSDQYTLGLILQELITLEKAIPGDGLEEALQRAAVGYRQPPAPPPGQRSLPRELRSIMDRALALVPGDRYPSVAALAEDLHRYLDGQAVLARPDTPLQRAARWLSQHRQATLLTMVGLLTLVFMSSTTFLYREQRAREAAAVREDALTRVLTATSSQAQRIDRHILRYEGLTMTIAAAAVQALTHGSDDPEPTYTDTDFDDPATAPPDLGWSPRYQRAVSIAWPSFVLAPGIARADVAGLLERLSPVRHTFRLAMLRSQGEAAVTLPDDQIHMLLVERGVPLVWAYVGFAEGVHMSYPGKGGYPDDYDPRQRPWYKNTVGTTGPRWGTPYLDALGQGLLLPCSMSLYDERHDFRGVAGVELTLDTVVHDLLELPGVAGIQETLLLNQEGLILVRSGQDQPPLDSKGELSFPAFADEDTVRTIRARGSGYLEADGTLTTYHRLGSLGWFYVSIGDAEDMLSR